MAWIMAMGAGSPEPPIPDPDPVTFNYTGNIQSYTVPKTGIYKIEVWGAQGGKGKGGYWTTGYEDLQTTGGKGGYTIGYATLVKSDVYYIVVGGKGQDWNAGYQGGYNGGGVGETNYTGGGGGATHIGKTESLLKDTNVSDVIIVAGAGGGGSSGFASGGQTKYGNGGAGGGLTGSNGGGHSDWTRKCGGGTQSAGGVAGTCSTSVGSPTPSGYGFGGGGHIENYSSSNSCGGGGAGFYGGGSGPNGGGSGGCGGGGGSSYYNTSILTDYSTTAGQQTGNGQATITWVSAS